jgi:hypothetical protein
MLALMGYMTKSMLVRYSHIRMAAKRDAAAGVTLRSKVHQPLTVDESAGCNLLRSLELAEGIEPPTL